jgi:hypothetical protein
MPMIVFSKADILRSQTMESQWASFEFSNVMGPTKNAAGDGYNYVVQFTLTDFKPNPELNGKEFKRTFSSKAMGMMIPLVAAVRNVDVQSIKDEFNFDTDELKGKKLDGKISLEMYEGRPTNKVEEYLAYGKGVNMQPAF